MFKWSVSDVGEHCAGYYGNSEGSRKVVVPAITLVSQVECLLEITWFCGQCHLTQEGIHQCVVVVDLTETMKEKFTASL